MFSTFLVPRDLTPARILESASYFGNNPRRCFVATRSRRNLVLEKDRVMKAIKEIPYTSSAFDILIGTRGPKGVSHTVFELDPIDEYRSLDGSRVEVVSMWALDKLLSYFERRQADAAAEFYMAIRGMPELGFLRGRVMERQALRYFDSFQVPTTLKIRSLSDSTIHDWEYPGPTRRVNFDSQTFITSLRTAVDAKKPVHLVPKDPNYPAVDSILYDPNAPFTLIQCCLHLSHPEVVAGFKRIQEKLKLRTPLAHLRPSISGRHWHLIFVVPFAIAQDLREQDFEGDMPTNCWKRKIDQYVFGITDLALWGKEMKV
jgi:hypothetical protein